MTKQTDEIAALRAELDALKGAVKASTAPDYEAMRKQALQWDDEMRALAEKRMSHAAHFSREDLRAMEAACPTSAVKDIVAKGGIPERSGHHPARCSPAFIPVAALPTFLEAALDGKRQYHYRHLGINWVDAQCIADDVKSRGKP
jgi:hypothetical protein